MKIYLVGIKGTGMSALACYLHDLGHEVIGSDISYSFGFETELLKRNIKINSFDESNILPNYVYIIGNAYHLENVEVQKIVSNDYKYYYYHEFISTLPGVKIGVSGTHGKTTTATFIRQLLYDEKIAYIIGDGTGYASSDYKYLIYESCEYQDHFLSYRPDILVITNIDYDHPDYFKNIETTIKSFYKASMNAGSIICLSNSSFTIKKITSTYTLLLIDNTIIKIPIVGIHNIYNFVLAYYTLIKLGFTTSYITSKVHNLRLPKRRTEETKINSNIIIEDYAHHPTEIKELYNLLKIKYPNKRKIVLFQPHTYSRTIKFIDGFINSLSLFDLVYIDKVFTSKREPYNRTLENKISSLFKMFKKYKDFKYENIEDSIIILLGAGSIIKSFKEKYLIYEKE
ncbi:MAG: hypothetical protein IKC22_01705 [Bacilli bacterium]|nr:hypothetical protein [Bacilli bacterium]